MSGGPGHSELPFTLSLYLSLRAQTLVYFPNLMRSPALAAPEAALPS